MQIYILKFNAPVGLVGRLRWLVRPAFTHQRKADRDDLCQKNHPSHGMNLVGVISGSSHIQGA